MTPISSDRVRKIGAWFHDHEDGEFVVVPADFPSSVVGDDSAPRTLIYTTKVHCVGHHLHVIDVARPAMIVGRPGLPLSADLVYLDRLLNGAACHFLGDADPPDILAFAWLRAHAAIGWLGVNDDLVNRNTPSGRTAMEIAMSEAEKQAMGALRDLCPDYRDLLGPRCSAALDRGFKIELEAAIINPRCRPGG